MNLGKPATALPLAEPPRDPNHKTRLPIEFDNRVPATPGQRAARARAAAERQAMIDLAFDPSRDMPAVSR